MNRRRELLGKTFGGGGGHGLPDEYQEVEWVQFENDSVVNSCIDTRIYENRISYVETRAKAITFGRHSYVGIVGTATGSVDHSATIKTNNTWNPIGWTLVDSDTYDDGSLYGLFAVGSWGSYVIFGAAIRGVNAWVNANCQIYYIKLLDNTETIIQEYYPCYRKSDGVIGFYDIINDTFRVNEGTGTLTKGADV